MSTNYIHPFISNRIQRTRSGRELGNASRGGRWSQRLFAGDLLSSLTPQIELEMRYLFLLAMALTLNFQQKAAFDSNSWVHVQVGSFILHIPNSRPDVQSDNLPSSVKHRQSANGQNNAGVISSFRSEIHARSVHHNILKLWRCMYAWYDVENMRRVRYT